MKSEARGIVVGIRRRKSSGGIQARSQCWLFVCRILRSKWRWKSRIRWIGLSWKSCRVSRMSCAPLWIVPLSCFRSCSNRNWFPPMSNQITWNLPTIIINCFIISLMIFWITRRSHKIVSSSNCRPSPFSRPFRIVSIFSCIRLMIKESHYPWNLIQLSLWSSRVTKSELNKSWLICSVTLLNILPKDMSRSLSRLRQNMAVSSLFPLRILDAEYLRACISRSSIIWSM